MGGHSASRAGLRMRHLHGPGCRTTGQARPREEAGAGGTGGGRVPARSQKQPCGDWWPSFWFVYSAPPRCMVHVSRILVFSPSL